MKQEVLNNLIGFLDYAKQGVDFVKEQAPLYVQELIKYSTVKYMFYTIFSFTGVILSLCMLIYGIVLLKNSDEDFGFPLFLFGIPSEKAAHPEGCIMTSAPSLKKDIMRWCRSTVTRDSCAGHHCA